jgi:hypothetical protein
MISWFSNYFWFSFLLFTANQILERFYKIPWLYSYLDDLLAPGIVLGFSLFFFQKVFPADKEFRLDDKLLISFLVLYSLLFELIFPWTDPRHTADYWDILAYAIGTLAFRFLGNRTQA